MNSFVISIKVCCMNGNQKLRSQVTDTCCAASQAATEGCFFLCSQALQDLNAMAGLQLIKTYVNVLIQSTLTLSCL